MRKFTNLICTVALLIAGNTIVSAQRITVTLAGNGDPSFSGDGGSSATSSINYPYDVKMDAAHNLYFADKENGRIRMIAAKNGTITTIAGGGIADGGGTSTADSIPATSAFFPSLSYFVLDAAGNIYLTTGNKVRRVDAITGIVTTIAGIIAGGYSGDGGAATAAFLKDPSGICMDNAGNIYISDQSNNRIRKITAATGIINTIAGTGVSGDSGDGGLATSALLDGPSAICMNSLGDLYFSDVSGSRIRKITAATGIITTIAGVGGSAYGFGNGGLAVDASVGLVHGICVDDSDNIYIDDDSCACRKITVTTGIINLVAGDTVIEGYNGDGVNALSAWFNYPTGLCIDGAHNIYVADKENNRIRKSILLTHKPIFAQGTGQSTRACPGIELPLNDKLSVADLDAAETETWTVLNAPVHGTLTGFPATAISGSVAALASPSGVYYLVASTYLGADSFRIKVSDGVLNDTVMIYVTAQNPDSVSILGAADICEDDGLDLASSDPGGVWTESNSTMFLSTGGVFIGTLPGTDTITYTVNEGCIVSAAVVINVNPRPYPGAIAGGDSVCVGSMLILTDDSTGGVWSTIDTTFATINTTTGAVTGVAVGFADMVYTLTIGTCSNEVDEEVYIADCSTEAVNNVPVASSINIYPNPVSSLLNIDWKELQDKKANITLTDITGTEIIKTILVNNNTSGSMQLDLSGIADGMYILSVNSTTMHYTDKIVVSRK